MKRQDINGVGKLRHMLHRMSRGAAGLVMAGLASAAAAQGTGWERLAANLTSLGKTGATAVTALAFLLGLCALAYGGKLLWDKGGERGEDIKMGRIVWTLVGGTVMIALGFVAVQTVETLGGQASDIGTPITTK